MSRIALWIIAVIALSLIALINLNKDHRVSEPRGDWTEQSSLETRKTCQCSCN